MNEVARRHVVVGVGAFGESVMLGVRLGMVYGAISSLPFVFMVGPFVVLGVFVGILFGGLYGIGAGPFVAVALGLSSWARLGDLTTRLVGGTVAGLSVALMGQVMLGLVDGHPFIPAFQRGLLMLGPAVLAAVVGAWRAPAVVNAEEPIIRISRRPVQAQ